MLSIIIKTHGVLEMRKTSDWGIFDDIPSFLHGQLLLLKQYNVIQT